ncbi:MAG: DUF6125 family protein [Chloroflexi bacterium]|nr:DUF6125 family protein [Chloroflexota bacterium]
MRELQDYSGAFDPNLRLGDFSKEALLRLFTAACKDYLGIDGTWLTLMRRKVGDETAFRYSDEVWQSGTEAEVRRTRQALNIRGDDVSAVLKYLQFTTSGGGGLFECTCELHDRNHGMYTVLRCPSLDYFERHGDMKLLKHACENVCIPYNQRSADCFNPRIKWVPTKLPPRESKKDIACQWEIKLEQ